MAVGFRSSSFSGQDATFGTSCVTPVPAGAASGDIAILAITLWESANPTVTWPTGFTEKVAVVSGNSKLKVAWKRLTGADTGNYTATWTGSQYNQGQCILVTGGVATGDPIEATNTATGTGTTVPSTSLTTVSQPFLAHFNENLDATSAATSTPPTNYTETQDRDWLHTNYRIPGTTGSHTASGGTISVSSLQLVALLAVTPASAGQSAAMGTVTETDAAQPIGKRKSKSGGVVIETDAAQPLGRRKVTTTSFALEADNAQSVGRKKVKALGAALETDTAVPITAPGGVAIGTATETDFPIAISKRKQQALAVVTEADTALSFGRVKRRALGVALETDTALFVGEAEPILSAFETDAAQSVGRVKRKAIGLAIETDTALGITRFVVTKIVKFPTYKERLGEPRLLSRYTKPESVSLIKKAGTWSEIVSPHQDEIAAAEGFWQGGHRHVLTDAQAADLPPQYVEEVQ